MKVALFYHSLVSDWNHGNAHFLRGIARELQRRGHEVRIFEPACGWSLSHLLREQGNLPIEDFHRAYPGLWSTFYELETLDLDRALDGIDLAIVHEWNDPELVRRIGAHHKSARRYRLFFHDTHHRCATAAQSMAAYDLTGYDGVLAYGRAVRDVYLARGWSERVWVWHEAADTRLFHPIANQPKEGDLVWIGNWGDEERTEELREFLVEPIRSLRIKARFYGVRYPPEALEEIRAAGIDYGGWLANFRVPEVFARFRLTAHIPRRPYVASLPGIPTIRLFEALASAIPLVCAPWPDSENLFAPGRDYLVATSGAEMTRLVRQLLEDEPTARALAAHGRETILKRHTCAHRVDELLEIVDSLNRELGSAERWDAL